LLSRFFIDRPIFAAVLSIAITLAGGIAVFFLPLAQYPPISPPVVSVDCTYPGASAQVVSEAVATPIEQQVNGVEDMLYMSSQCTNDGVYNLTVTFKSGVDLNMAQVLVQNRVSLALPSLPDVVKQTGVTTRKRSPDILLVVGLISPNGRYDQTYLSNYAIIQVKDELSRLPGVSDVIVFGQRDYSMRIWVDPEKIAYRGMTAGDVLRAIREHNIPVAAGQLGQQPVPSGQEVQYPFHVLGRLNEPEQFEQIVVKRMPDGRVVRLRDVGKVVLGPRAQNISNRLSGEPAVGIAIFQFPDANALDVGERVMAKMDELSAGFPEGLEYAVGYDTVPYTRESIGEVFKTLQDAILLVAAVVLLFLQNWRSALIPLVAVPVAIIGTFAVMLAFGFSLNNLTLFGLVLAIGIVVDDAIVVVEAVEHHIEQGLPPRQATIKAMEQVSGPVIAVGLVLSAVFVPCAFIGGITGQFFRQFALTISVSTIISAFNSLTLSPALAAVLLRPKTKRRTAVLPSMAFLIMAGWLGYAYATPWVAAGLQSLPGFDSGAWRLDYLAPTLAVIPGLAIGWLIARPLNFVLSWLFHGFNQGFRKTTDIYARLVGMMLRVAVVVLIIYGGLVGLTYWSFQQMPRGFVPNQDMGYLLLNIQLPDSASSERTLAVVKQVEDIVLSTPGVRYTSAVAGQSFFLNATGSNFGSMFIILDNFNERRDPELNSERIAMKLRQRFAQEVFDAQLGVFGPPPIRGVGRSGGFKVMVEDRGDGSPAVLQKQVENLIDEGAKTGALVGLSSIYRANVPQLYIDIDRQECMTREIALKDVFDTLQIYLGSFYVNDFNRFGRTWQVVLQAEHPYRDELEDVRKLQVRNARGAMVPLGSVAKVKEVNGPLVLTRYNMYPAAAINGATADGISSSEGIRLLQELAQQELPQNMAIEWTEMAYLELLSGNTAMLIFVLAVMMVFLVLAAQYESWSLPLAVILVVPMCLLSAIIGVAIAGDDINIFTQIGFVVLVGLASKNAILIVEFAKQQRLAGADRRQATLDACHLRLRPIIMTSLAFVLGVVPMILSTGAGSEMRRILGTAVFSGMLGVTLFGIFLTPVFFYVIDWLGEARLWRWPLLHHVHRGSLVGLGWVRDLSTLGPVRRRLAQAGNGKPAPVIQEGRLSANAPPAAATPDEAQPEVAGSRSSRNGTPP
jgi:multidrug efflux pump